MPLKHKKAELFVAHAVGGIDNHVHLLISLPRTKTLAKVVEILKSRSSQWLKTKRDDLAYFSWQSGYGAFSVSQSHVEQVRRYIASQEEHHRKITFQDELREFLRRYEVEYDERYLWD